MANLNQEMRFIEFLLGNGMDFYEEFLKNLSEEELIRFLDENPEYYLFENNRIL